MPIGDLAGEEAKLEHDAVGQCGRGPAAPSRSEARVPVRSSRHDLVGVEVLEALELDRRLQVSSDSIVGGPVRGAAHVVAKTAAIPPPAHHDDFIRLAVRAPNLQALNPLNPSTRPRRPRNAATRSSVRSGATRKRDIEMYIGEEYAALDRF